MSEVEDKNADVWNPKALQQFSVGDRQAIESFLAAEDQLAYTLQTFAYVVGSGSLQVYQEGHFLNPGIDFVETSPTSFSISNPVQGKVNAGDIITAVGATGSPTVVQPGTGEIAANTIWTEFSVSIGALEFPGAGVGFSVITNYYNGNHIKQSGAHFSYTGTIDAGKAGDVPNFDGYFYDLDGKQFKIISEFPNVLQFGAVGDNIADDYLPCQSGINFVQFDVSEIAGLIYFPGTKGAYNCSQALTHTQGHGFAILGDGRSSKISNVTAGNTLEFGIAAGDSSTQYNQPRLNAVMVSNGVVGGTAVFARWRPDFRILECVFEGFAVDGFGLRIEETIACLVFGGISQGTRNIAFSVTERSHGFSLMGMRCDGNGNALELPQIGVYLKGVSNINIGGGTVLESYPGAAVLVDADCSAINLNGCYYEDNAMVGLTFTGAGARNIKADIVISGGSFPALSSATPVQGVTVEGNYFEPDSVLPIDATIYLIAVQGFEEGGNVVNSPYVNPGSASFIKTFLDSAIYQADNVVLGQSHIEGAPVDKYFDMENLNVTTTPSNYAPFPRTMQIPEVNAPRFNAFEDAEFQPEEFIIKISGTTSISQVLASELRQGQYAYDVTKVAAGTSDAMGAGPVLEANYDDYWDDTIWVFYAEAKAVTNTPGLELLVHVAGLGATLSGNGEALTTDWKPRIVLMKPQAGLDINYVAWRMSVGSGGDVARVTRPIFCPLGALQDILGKTVFIDLEGTVVWDPADIADGGPSVNTTVTVPGAQVGDQVVLSFTNPLQGLVLSGEVSAANTVTATLSNSTGGNVNLLSGTVRARVIRF